MFKAEGYKKTHAEAQRKTGNYRIKNHHLDFMRNHFSTIIQKIQPKLQKVIIWGIRDTPAQKRRNRGFSLFPVPCSLFICYGIVGHDHCIYRISFLSRIYRRRHSPCNDLPFSGQADGQARQQVFGIRVQPKRKSAGDNVQSG